MKQDIKEINAKMETVLSKAIEEFDGEGIYFAVIYRGELGLKMAHVSNMKPKYMIAALKEWIEIQEGTDERDRPN